jgi:hypothetical protein
MAVTASDTNKKQEYMHQDYLVEHQQHMYTRYRGVMLRKVQ